MPTIKLKIIDTFYDRLIWLLNKFTKDEVEIIIEESNFSETKRYLEAELDEIIGNKAAFLTLNETEQILGNLIKREDQL